MVCSRPGPSAAAMVMARMMIGNAMTMSVQRMSRSSTQPAPKPAMAPMKPPIASDDGDHAEADRQRDASAVQHAAEDVAAERVGAEPVRRRRRLQAVDDALGERAVRRDSGAATLTTIHPARSRRR